MSNYIFNDNKSTDKQLSICDYIYFKIYLKLSTIVGCLTLFRIRLFGAAHGCGGEKGPFPKTSQTKMKLGTVIP